MKTIFDWASLLMFSGIIFVFYNQIEKAKRLSLSDWATYLFTSTSCAIANVAGNAGQTAGAAVIYIGLALFGLFAFQRGSKSNP